MTSGSRETGRRCRPRWVLLVAPLVVLMSLPVSASAGQQDDDRQKPTYQVRVLAIRASKDKTETSKELEPIAAALRKRFSEYKGFQLEKKSQGSVKEDKAFSASLIPDYTLKVTPLATEGKRVKLRLELFRKDGDKQKRQWSLTVTDDKGKYSLQAQPLREGEALIVAVSAR